MTDLTSKLPELLLFGSEFDLLTYSRRHHPGLTLPLLTLKLPNHWFGARPAPLSLCTLNINTGAGAVDWWVMESEPSARLRDYLLNTRGVDILQSETELWPDENFLMIEGLQSYHGRQAAGDIVYLGPGVCAWGKCKAACIDISWRIGLKTEKQMQMLFAREEIDRAIGQNCSINIWTMALDYMNNDLANMPENALKLLATKLTARFSEECKLMASSELPYMGVVREHEAETCHHCKQALFYAYTRCEECKYSVCLCCAHKHIHPLSVCYSLFRPEAFERLKSRVEARLMGEAVDCVDPSLQLHTNLLTKGTKVNLYQTPCHGIPSYSLFATSDSKPQKRPHSHTVKPRISRTHRHKSEMKALADLIEPTEDNDSQPDKKCKTGPDELPD